MSNLLSYVRNERGAEVAEWVLFMGGIAIMAVTLSGVMQSGLLEKLGSFLS